MSTEVSAAAAEQSEGGPPLQMWLRSKDCADPEPSPANAAAT